LTRIFYITIKGNIFGNIDTIVGNDNVRIRKGNRKIPKRK